MEKKTLIYLAIGAAVLYFMSRRVRVPAQPVVQAAPKYKSGAPGLAQQVASYGLLAQDAIAASQNAASVLSGAWDSIQGSADTSTYDLTPTDIGAA